MWKSTALNERRRLSRLPVHPRRRAGVVGERLYVFGGEIPRPFGEVEVYDPTTVRWQSLDPMPEPRHGIVAGVIGNIIYIPGGGTRQGLGATNVNSAFHVRP